MLNGKYGNVLDEDESNRPNMNQMMQMMNPMMNQMMDTNMKPMMNQNMDPMMMNQMMNTNMTCNNNEPKYGYHDDKQNDGYKHQPNDHCEI